MNRTNTFKRILSTFLIFCMLLSCVEYTAYAAPSAQDGEVVKQGSLVTSEDGMVTVLETAAHTSGNNFNVTMTVTTSDLVEIEPVRPAHIVLCIDRSNSMDGERRTNTKVAVDQFVAGVLDENGIAAGNQIAVVGFGTRYWDHCGLTDDISTVASAVRTATTAVSNVNDGGTNVQAGIYAAHQILAADTSSARKVIVLFSDGMPTYSYRLTGTADWTGCTNSGRRHNWNQSNGSASNVITEFDHNTIVGSGSDFSYTQDNHYASLNVSCEHGKSTTMTSKIYTNNGQPAIAQAREAKDSGIEIYTVFLDGYNAGEQSSKKNAEDTMKAVATNEDHYMATKDMSELSDLFESIGSSLVTPTNAGIVTAPMGSYIQLGEVSGLQSAGITRTAAGLIWNVTAVTPSVDASTGIRSYTVTFPVSLQVEEPGFVEAAPYMVNSSAVLAYSVGGVEKQLSFDIPTVRGYLPLVSYSICYYLQGTADAGDYVNYALQDTDSGLTGKLHSKISYPAGYETKYPNHAFVYSSTGSEMTLSSTGANVMCLYYDSTYVPPVAVDYTVRHEYYTNGVRDILFSTEQTGDAGTVLTADSLSKQPVYGEKTYTFTSCTPAELTLQEGGENTITLRYDRTEVLVPYTVIHAYYTNDTKDGEVPAQASGPEGAEISGSMLEKKTSFSGAEYIFTSFTPDKLTLVSGETYTIILRYDRTVEIPPVEVGYTVIYEYYTNGEKDGEVPAPQIGQDTTVIVGDDLPKLPTYKSEEYKYTDSIPRELTLTPGAPSVIRLRYDRMVKTPPATKYTIIHQYYSGDKLDGQLQESFDGNIGEIIAAAGITKNTEFSNGTYTFTSANFEVIVLSEGGENKLIFRYIRPDPDLVPDPALDPAPDPVPDPQPTPSGADSLSPKTGDNSNVWLYVFAGVALALIVLFVVPVISRPKEGGRYRGSRKKK